MAKVKKDRKAKMQESARGGGKSAARAAKPAAKAKAAKPAAKRAARAGAAAPRAAKKPAPVPPGMHTVTPTLTLSDCAKAIEFYKEAFGAQERERFPSPDGKSVWHAALGIGDSTVFVSDAMDPSVKPPSREAPSAVGVFLYVPDCDAVFEQATKAGATAVMPVADMFWGDRMGALLDPYGVRWSIATHVKDMTAEEMRKAGEEFASKMAGAQGGGREGAGSSEAPAA